MSAGYNQIDDNRFEIIARVHKRLVDATNIEDRPDEMKVLDSILFRFWQMGWLDHIEACEVLKANGASLRVEAERDPCDGCSFRGPFPWVCDTCDYRKEEE